MKKILKAIAEAMIMFVSSICIFALIIFFEPEKYVNTMAFNIITIATILVACLIILKNSNMED